MLVSSIKITSLCCVDWDQSRNTRRSHSPMKLKPLEASGRGRLLCQCFFCGVVLVVCNCMMYHRSFKLGVHEPSPSYVTRFCTVHWTGCCMTQQKKWQPVLCTMRSSYINKGFSIKKLIGEFVLLPLVFLKNFELGVLFFNKKTFHFSRNRYILRALDICNSLSLLGSHAKQLTLSAYLVTLQFAQ